MQKNYYQVLRIKNDASAEEIEQAFFRAKARLVQSGIDDPDSQALLQEAHDALADPASREAYDESLRTPPPPPPRLRATPMPPPVATAEEPALYGDGDQERAERPRWLVPALIMGGAVVLLVGGLMMMRGGPVPVPPRDPSRASAPSTGTVAVSSEPLAPVAAASTSGSSPPSSAPRTGEQVFAEVSQSVVRVVVMDENARIVGGGSGVVTARGTVITNCHVALRGITVEVRAGKDSFPASVNVADETYDLCSLSVSGGFNAPAVEIGNMQYVRSGQKVFAIGAPQGLELTISEGIVSSIRETRLGNILQTTAPISPGSSGGGLFNVSGQLIGITTFQLRSGQNLNFAVPADWIADMTSRPGPGPSLD